MTAVSYLAPYAAYVRRNIAAYLREHQALPPKALVLVAVLQPYAPAPVPGAATAGREEQGKGQGADSTDGAGGAGGDGNGVGPGAVLSGSRARVIGTAEVSFNPSTRSSQPFLDAPAVSADGGWWLAGRCGLPDAR